MKAKGEVRLRRGSLLKVRITGTFIPISRYAAPARRRGRPRQIQRALQLFAKIDGDDGGWRFGGAQTVVIARRCHADAQQILILDTAAITGGKLSR